MHINQRVRAKILPGESLDKFVQNVSTIIKYIYHPKRETFLSNFGHEAKIPLFLFTH